MRVHPTMPRTAAAAAVAAAGLALAVMASPASAGPAITSPPADGSSGQSAQPDAAATSKATINAVLVKSWGTCSSGSLVWDQLNATWETYGSIEVVVDYSDPVCQGPVTLAALEASGADVVIVSNPSGGGQVFTPSEVEALEAYAAQGHGVVGTYLALAFPGSGVDNTALAPLFGLEQDAGWTGGDAYVDKTYTMTKKAKSLRQGLGKTWASQGFDMSQRPGDGVWSKNELAGAKIVGTNPGKTSVITTYKGDGYRAVYIGTMVEYQGGAQDIQFLYNAITFPKKS